MCVSEDGVLFFELFELKKGGRDIGLAELIWESMLIIRFAKKTLPTD